MQTNLMKSENGSSSVSERTKSNTKICIMGPDTPEQLRLQNILLSRGFQVLSIHEVIGSSNEIKRFGPHILVLDVNMNTLSGIRLIKVLRKNLVQMPILILYADMDRGCLQKIAMETFANDFVVKDDGHRGLLSSIRRELERRKMWKNPDTGMAKAGPEIKSIY